MKLQICVLFAVVAFACALPVPDEAVVPAETAVANEIAAEPKVEVPAESTDAKSAHILTVAIAEAPKPLEAIPITDVVVEEKKIVDEDKIAPETLSTERKLEETVAVVEPVKTEEVVPAAVEVVDAAAVESEVRAAKVSAESEVETKVVEAVAGAVDQVVAAVVPAEITEPKSAAVVVAEEKKEEADVTAAVAEPAAELKTDERQIRNEDEVAPVAELKKEAQVEVAEPEKTSVDLIPAENIAEKTLAETVEKAAEIIADTPAVVAKTIDLTVESPAEIAAVEKTAEVTVPAVVEIDAKSLPTATIAIADSEKKHEGSSSESTESTEAKEELKKDESKESSSEEKTA